MFRTIVCLVLCSGFILGIILYVLGILAIHELGNPIDQHTGATEGFNQQLVGDLMEKKGYKTNHIGDMMG